jgi:hypothetical protein
MADAKSKATKFNQKKRSKTATGLTMFETTTNKAPDLTTVAKKEHKRSSVAEDGLFSFGSEMQDLI